MKNKTKAEITADIKQRQKVEHMKDVVRKTYPLLEPLDSIYDAQTTCNAISGFIKADLEEKINEIKLEHISFDLSKEKDSKIKTQMLGLVDVLKDEPAQDLAQILERLGQAFSQFGSSRFLKGPMTDLKLEEILAD